MVYAYSENLHFKQGSKYRRQSENLRSNYNIKLASISVVCRISVKYEKLAWKCKEAERRAYYSLVSVAFTHRAGNCS